jgi:serine phosphatase RsbU (regulator of sigma subunit)
VSLERPFVAGSRLFLYSDGLVEAISEHGEPFGYERLANLLRGSADRPGNALIGSVLETLGEFTGGTPLADDLTLLVLERTS